MTPKAVIFDCDGVIVDSERATFQLLCADFADHGLHMTPDQVAKAMIGGTMAGIAVQARTLGADLAADWVDRFYVKLYAHLAQGTALIPGIVSVLDALDAAGIPYAVGSNGSDAKMQVTLGQHPDVLRRVQGRLFSGQTLGTPKPAPDLYLHAAAALGTAPADCVVIEDSATGARAARAAGIRCWGYAPQDDGGTLAAEGATVFHHMENLPALLGLR